MEKIKDSFKAPLSVVDALFNVGAHFGFVKSRRHPSVKPFIFGTKNKIEIFDLEKTSKELEKALDFIKTKGQEGALGLIVGGKSEARESVKNAGLELQMPYIAGRWIGGTLTNFSQIQKRIAYLATLRSQQESGELEHKYTKKEQLLLTREMEKLVFDFGGIAAMERLPAALIVVDPRHEATAVREAHDVRIPVIAVMSSDCNAGDVTLPVFVNDAHRASVTLALDELVEGYKEAV